MADDDSQRRREKINVRLSVAGLAEIDEFAKAEDRTRSAMIRVLLSEAIQARRKKASWRS